MENSRFREWGKDLKKILREQKITLKPNNRSNKQRKFKRLNFQLFFSFTNKFRLIKYSGHI